MTARLGDFLAIQFTAIATSIIAANVADRAVTRFGAERMIIVGTALCAAGSMGQLDTEGRLLMIDPTAANISDSTGAQKILEGTGKRWPWMKHLFADGGYDGTKPSDKAARLDFTVEIVRRIDTDPVSRCCPDAGTSSGHSVG